MSRGRFLLLEVVYVSVAYVGLCYDRFSGFLDLFMVDSLAWIESEHL